MPINISKQSLAPCSPCIPQSLPVTGPSWLAYPALHPKFSSPGGWATLPYEIQPFHFGYPLFLYLWASRLLHLVPSFPSLSLPLPVLPYSKAHSGWSCPLWMLRGPASGYALPRICSKLSPPPYPRPITLLCFPFSFFSFFHSFGDETGTGINELPSGYSAVPSQAADLALPSMDHLFLLASDTHRIRFQILESGSSADAFLYLLSTCCSCLSEPPCGHLRASLVTTSLTGYTHVDFSHFSCSLSAPSLLAKSHQNCLICLPLLHAKPVCQEAPQLMGSNHKD